MSVKYKATPVKPGAYEDAALHIGGASGALTNHNVFLVFVAVNAVGASINCYKSPNLGR